MASDLNGLARHWRLRARRYRLTGRRCAKCGIHAFPPRAVCLPCAEKINWLFDSEPVVIDLAPLAFQSAESENRRLQLERLGCVDQTGPKLYTQQ